MTKYKYNSKMKVIKRNGLKEPVSFDKVTNRISQLCNNLNIDPIVVSQKVCMQIYDNVKTFELDELAARICADMCTLDLEYGILASRIIISNNHKNTSPSFSETIQTLYDNKDINGKHVPLISDEVYEIVMANANKLNSVIDYTRDYNFDYFGYKTLEKAYLFRVGNKLIERIQHMFMRVSIGLHKNDIQSTIVSYNMMSQKYFIHATPTLYHAGTPLPQYLSCFLSAVKEDSIKGIYGTLSDCAQISKWAGGIGLHVSEVRSKGMKIRGTNGKSDGIIPMLKVYNETAKYVNQCFTPDTQVYGKDGCKTMDSIKEGDELYTIDGSLKRVNNIIINKVNKEILEIKTSNSLVSVKVTKEHEIYVLQNVSKNRILRDITYTSVPKFIPAGEISLNDMVAYPIPKYICDYENINEDKCRFYGIYLREGVISNGYMVLYYTENNRIDYEFVIRYLYDNNIKYIESDNIISGKYIKIDISSNKLFFIKEKNKISKKYLNLPKYKIIELLKGIFGVKNIFDDYLRYEMKTYQMFKDVQYLLLKVGIPITGYSTDISWIINSFHNENKYFVKNDIIWCRINSIKTINYNGNVIDFNMEDNHNYLTEMGLVHNSGKRPGAFAIYLEPHHPDIMSFLDLRKNSGNEDERARDLFLAMWISDLFMERVESNSNWSLLDPDECPGLTDVYGEDYKKLYEKYETEGKIRGTVKARDIWNKILDSQIETGTPYISFKDHVNRKNNQKHYGTIKSSNLCNEINEVSNQEEIACCTLASIGLPTYVKNGIFDYNKLIEVISVVVRNLNKVIDDNFYPVPETKVSNIRHRPLGLGVQGLADVFFKMKIPFDSTEARQVNIDIFEALYYGALKASCDLAKEQGTYPKYDGCPASKGILQFDMWNVKPSDKWDWDSLKKDIIKYGLRNSLLIALMPTASTAQILGNTEAFEPITSNIYSRRTIAGDFILINKYMVADLMKEGLWNEDLKDNIIFNNGSIQNIEGIPQNIKNLYKTVWEIKQKVIIDMAADRGPFICQTQSMNLFFEEPTYNMLTSAFFYGWKKGLKTGSYYIRSRPKTQAQQFTIDPNKFKNKNKNKNKNIEALICSLENPTACEMCSS